MGLETIIGLAALVMAAIAGAFTWHQQSGSES